MQPLTAEVILVLNAPENEMFPISSDKSYM